MAKAAKTPIARRSARRMMVVSEKCDGLSVEVVAGSLVRNGSLHVHECEGTMNFSKDGVIGHAPVPPRHRGAGDRVQLHSERTQRAACALRFGTNSGPHRQRPAS